MPRKNAPRDSNPPENIKQSPVRECSRKVTRVRYQGGADLSQVLEQCTNWIGFAQELKPLLPTRSTVHNAQFSPDGQWIAYASSETGNWEVYVSPFPAAGSKWLVSSGGGVEPRWRRDGKELYYLSPEGKMIAVAVKTGAKFESGPPVTLFQARLHQSISAMDVCSYDASADGQRFLINTKVDAPSAAPLTFILNWVSQVEK